MPRLFFSVCTVCTLLVRVVVSSSTSSMGAVSCARLPCIRRTSLTGLFLQHAILPSRRPAMPAMPANPRRGPCLRASSRSSWTAGRSAMCSRGCGKSSLYESTPPCSLAAHTRVQGNTDRAESVGADYRASRCPTDNRPRRLYPSSLT